MVSVASKRFVSDHIGWMGQDLYLVEVCVHMRLIGSLIGIYDLTIQLVILFPNPR